MLSLENSVNNLTRFCLVNFNFTMDSSSYESKANTFSIHARVVNSRNEKPTDLDLKVFLLITSTTKLDDLQVKGFYACRQGPSEIISQQEVSLSPEHTLQLTNGRCSYSFQIKDLWRNMSSFSTKSTRNFLLLEVSTRISSLRDKLLFKIPYFTDNGDIRLTRTSSEFITQLLDPLSEEKKAINRLDKDIEPPFDEYSQITRIVPSNMQLSLCKNSFSMKTEAS